MILRPKHNDVPEIQKLLSSRSDMLIGPEHINRRDISLIARKSGRIVGFLWIGLMAGNKVAYIDKFVVAKNCAHEGIGNALARAALSECKKRGVKEVHGFILQGPSHDSAAMNALRMALGAEPKPFTYVRGQIDFIEAELASLNRSIA